MYKLSLAIAFVACQLHAYGQQKGTGPGKATTAPIDYEHTGSPMPSVRLVTVDSIARIYTHKDLDNNANLLVMMFNPLCGHCEDQTELLVKNIAVFKHSKLVMMVEPEMSPYLPNFIWAFHLKDHAEIIKVGLDSARFIKNTFLYQALPQINIYNRDRKLIKTYCGGVSMDTLMQYIE